MKGFEQFIREKTYLSNVSPATVYWYRQSFKSLENPDPTATDLTEWIVRLRQKGVRAESVNTYSRAVNCYLHWRTGSDKPCSAQCEHLKVPKLKVPHKIPSTFTERDIRTFVSWKPKKRCERRLHTLLLLLADTGVRVSEAINLRWKDVDLDNMLLLIHGKGGRDRKVAFSLELRKLLFKYQQNASPEELIFTTSQRTQLTSRNVLRDVKRLCRKLSIPIPERTVHAVRHTFAVNYLRRGGSVFHLQKALGHSTLDMTREYANLLTDDLVRIHDQVSLLTPTR